MPLFKNEPFVFVDPPCDLDPGESTYCVRFTKEIFRDYEEYVNRIHLYQQRLWTCSVTGKANLTYEEAVISEKLAESSKKNHTKHPINNSLLVSASNGHILKDRPSPAKDFIIPVDCVGDLLMVWDFCYSFSKLLCLWPFSFDDFERAICHEGSNLVLIAEAHSSVLHLVIEDKGQYFRAVKKKKRNLKITSLTWVDYLCDFLEMEHLPELSGHLGIIKRGHYGYLEPSAKLDIFCEIIAEALETNAIRLQLDDHIDRRHSRITIGEEAHEGARKRKQGPSLANHVNKVLASGAQSVEGNGLLNNIEDVSGLHNAPSLCEALHTMEREPLKHQLPLHSGDGPSKSENQLEKVQLNGAIVDDGSEQNSLSNMLKVYTSRKKRALSEGSQIFVPLNEPNAEIKNTSVNEGMMMDKHSKMPQNKKFEEPFASRHHRKEEFQQAKQFVQFKLLGKDRDYNRYWFFQRDGRIFVESSDLEQWGFYATKEELDALIGSLDSRGEREKALHKQLVKHYSKICVAMEKRLKHVTLQKTLVDTSLRRSARVQKQGKDCVAASFLRYINKWKK